MVRIGLIALVVAAPAVVGACKGNSKPADKPATTKVEEPPPPPEPRIPAGEAHVTLPKLDGKQGHRIGTATAFVAIAKDGTVTQGKVGTGADPYAGKPHGAATSLEDELFGAGTAPPPPNPPDPPPPPPDDYGSYDPQVARQQAIDAARQAGVLGSLTLQSSTYGEFDAATGQVDALVLADRDAPAEHAIAALAQLARHKTALAVDGGGTPDAVQFRFAAPPTTPETPMAYVYFYDADLSVTRIDSRSSANLPASPGVALDTAKIAATLRPTSMTPMTGEVSVQLAHTTTVQQLADVLGALGSIGTPRVLITTVPNYGDGAFGSLTGGGDINGGFGYGQDGGGGTGWGTIGTGNGTGYGIGGANTNVPAVKIGTPSTVGSLDKAIIRRYIKRNIQKIQYCYEKELLAKPDLAGTVKAEFFITPDGYVDSSTASGMDDEVASCVAQVIQVIEFPKPKGGGGVQVNYPFIFRSAK
jgi:hypothetical protein